MGKRVICPKLKEPCRSAIQDGRCLGCSKLEDVRFTGDENCQIYDKKKEYSTNWTIPGRS